jgi:hypothetical protein
MKLKLKNSKGRFNFYARIAGKNNCANNKQVGSASTNEVPLKSTSSLGTLPSFRLLSRSKNIQRRLLSAQQILSTNWKMNTKSTFADEISSQK